MSGHSSNRGQRGSATAEFAVVAGFFFMMLILIIEMGRLIYTHNALTDAARRGARYAVLHNEDDPCVAKVVVYGETNVDLETCTASGPALIGGLTEANVVVTYEGADIDGDPDSPQIYGANLGTATVTIQNYSFRIGVPFIGLTITLPSYTTTLTAESSGYVPDDI